MGIGRPETFKQYNEMKNNRIALVGCIGEDA